ncbi:hypothetical protein L1987_16725 [Smallanthus sonchifolius]|uniref:Uncharacterized protein n=1 Tax=Smallanthus sonchifolius TaxID=185202 RepID=A0ACB9IVG7_9ASTR|nr:hypothetical protein L1987_16725 [Smallanthus sonchifolius]
MRKHGWQLPYHPLQVVAVSVFLALGFGFYVFFAPFVGKKKMYQYVVIGIYTPLIMCVFGLYIWCAGSDPADAGVFKSRKYCKTPDSKTDVRKEGSKHGGESQNKDTNDDKSKTENATSSPSRFMAILRLIPCALMCHCSSPEDESSEHQASEDGMFYCSLCEVEVFKYSKHCRVCDKCVDRFDHHCRWLNNCIGKRNYIKFFTLMVSALLLLILQWSTGIVVLISCAVDHTRFRSEIASKLGSSFTLAPYVAVVAVCTILAMIATLPLVQLFFFHILLIKKGISTYDYIIALREQEHQGFGGQQSPQMSPASSLTGFSSVSSFNTFRQGAWCTPPRLFVEDQYDVVPHETSSVSSLGKKTLDDPIKKKNPTAVKISPWTLARLNAEDVSKAAAEARKKSKILQPVSRKEVGKMGSNRLERDRSFGRSDRHMSSSRLGSKQQLHGISSSLVPLQLEAHGVFRAIGSSPDSSLDSPNIQPCMVSSGAGRTEMHRDVRVSGGPEKQGIVSFSRSVSDGYDASGGEDSDRVPSRSVQRSGNTSARPFDAGEDDRIARLKMPSSSKFSYPTESKI